MRHVRQIMSSSSLLPYLLWRILPGTTPPIAVRVFSGERIILRKPPATDLAVAWEVFGKRDYTSPRVLVQSSVSNIVDVGANVGYTAVYFGRHYPGAHITAFEPHPAQVSMLRRNLDANGLVKRVTIHAAAAGLSNSAGYLVDAGAMSRVVSVSGAGRLPIKVLDFFEVLKQRPIDLLKLDCEGSEYPLIMDPRFAALSVRALVLEWHAMPDVPEVRIRLRQRLLSLGWTLEERRTAIDYGCGIIWAYRD